MSSTNEQREPMRIVSWNIRAGGGVRAEKIALQLKRWEPSVVVLCEFRGTPASQYIASELRSQGLVHQRMSIDPEHLPTNALLIASRWPLRLLSHQSFPVEPCRWLSVSVRAPRPLVLGAMHIPNRETGRKYDFHKSVLETAKRWRPREGLIVGDTNTGWPDLDEEVPCFGAKEQRFMQAMQEGVGTTRFASSTATSACTPGTP